MELFKHVISLVVLASSVSSCDFVDSYSFTIENKTNEQLVVSLKVKYPSKVRDSITFDTIDINEKKLIYYGYGGICGRTEHPERLEEFYKFEYIKVFKNDSVLIKRNLLDESIWDYSTKPRVGFYNFVITNADF